MALDKVVDSAKLEADLTTVADAIRTKGGTAEQLAFPDGFATAVGAITSGKPEQEKTVDITANGTTEITPDVGKTLSKVVANVNVSGGGGGNLLPPVLRNIVKVPLTKETQKTVDIRLGDLDSCIVIAMFHRVPVKIPDGFTVLLDGLDIDFNQKLLILYRMVQPDEAAVSIRFENDGKSRQAAMVYTFSNCGVPSYQESNSLKFISTGDSYGFSLRRSNHTNARLYVCHFAVVSKSSMSISPNLYIVEGTNDDSGTGDYDYIRLFSFYSNSDFSSIDASLYAPVTEGRKGAATFIELPGVPAEKSSVLLSKSSMSLYERDSETLHTIEEVL